MARLFSPSLLSAAVFLSACAPVAPRELEGLWSRTEGACAMGAGVRFEARAVRVYYGRDDRVLFEVRRYRVERRGAAMRVTIDYELPARASASPGQMGRGVMILERGADGWIRPVDHPFAEKGTGAVRIRLSDDEAARYFTLRPCAVVSPSRQDLPAG